MLVSKTKYKELEKALQSLMDDETVFMDRFRSLAKKGKTYKQIATILDCDRQYLYAKARKHQVEVRRPWDDVSQYFTAMLEMHLQGKSYRDIGQKHKVSHVRIHKIFANNGYIGFADDNVTHNTVEAEAFAKAYRKALTLDISKGAK